MNLFNQVEAVSQLLSDVDPRSVELLYKVRVDLLNLVINGWDWDCGAHLGLRSITHQHKK